MSLRLKASTLYAHPFPPTKVAFQSWLSSPDPSSVPHFVELEATLFVYPRQHIRSCGLPRQVAFELLRMYYGTTGLEFSMLDALGKKVKSLPRSRWCDNVRRVHDTILLSPGARRTQATSNATLLSEIMSEFCLDPSIALHYAYVVFFAAHRFDCHRRRFSSLVFQDWAHLAHVMLQCWTATPIMPEDVFGNAVPSGSLSPTNMPALSPTQFGTYDGEDVDDTEEPRETTNRTENSDVSSSESEEATETTSREKPLVGFDARMVDSLIELRSRFQLDGTVRNLLRVELERRRIPVRYERSDRIGGVLKALVQIAGNLGNEKQVRQLFYDLYEKVCEPLVERMGLNTRHSLCGFVDAVAVVMDLHGAEPEEAEAWRRFCIVVRESLGVFVERCSFS